MAMAIGAGLKINDTAPAGLIRSHTRFLAHTIYGQAHILQGFPKPETLLLSGSLSKAKQEELDDVISRLRTSMRLLVTLHHSIRFLVSLARDCEVDAPLYEVDDFNAQLASAGDPFANHSLTAAYGGYAQAVLAQTALLEVTLSDVQALVNQRMSIAFAKEVVAEALRTAPSVAKPADFDNTNLARAVMRTTGKTVQEFVSPPPPKPAEASEKPPKPTASKKKAASGGKWTWRKSTQQQQQASTSYAAVAALPAAPTAPVLPAIVPAPAPPAAPPAAPVVAQRAARRNTKSGSH
jgi:hypothetical protein